MSLVRLSEIVGTLLAMSGALLLALNIEVSKFAYVLFLLGGPMMAWVLHKNKLWWLLALQIVYFMTNVLGAFRWL